MDPVMVFAPVPILTVTIEQKGSDDDVHAGDLGSRLWARQQVGTRKANRRREHDDDEHGFFDVHP